MNRRPSAQLANRKVLISGASIAGPALAYWLGRHGFTPTVVELAPAPRRGGHAVDFRGDTHLTVLDRMGLLPQLRRLQTGGSPIRFVDAAGRTLLHLPAEFAGGEIEVLREDLARVLYEHSAPYAEYVFGDSVTGLAETASGVRVGFRSGAVRDFDLVIGADGLHSNVRRLAFGPERDYVSHLGYYAATWPMPGNSFPRFGRGSVGYSTPGRFVSVGADHRDPARAGAFAVFASPPLRYDRHDPDRHKQLIADAFAGLGWEVPRLIATLEQAPDLYFDAISRADVGAWSQGRVCLRRRRGLRRHHRRHGHRNRDRRRLCAGRRAGRGPRRPPDGVHPLREPAAQVRPGLPVGRRPHREIPRPRHRDRHTAAQRAAFPPPVPERHAADGAEDQQHRWRCRSMRSGVVASGVSGQRPGRWVGRCGRCGRAWSRTRRPVAVGRWPTWLRCALAEADGGTGRWRRGPCAGRTAPRAKPNSCAGDRPRSAVVETPTARPYGRGSLASASTCSGTRGLARRLSRCHGRRQGYVVSIGEQAVRGVAGRGRSRPLSKYHQPPPRSRCG
ncbi:FAD-dependent monooxygenase [Yinghuangia aomiensis]